MKYRPEIDGLRALAVTPVMLFHAGFELFGGGFVGVDVFFVVSGYLITTILIEDLENNQFNLFDFYERRARRILPALFAVLLVCVPFAWAWLLPRDLLGFAQSLIAVLVFGSNIFFWKKSDYFSPDSELQPLLHTWSLAVEEQFYLFFPIGLLLAWRFGKHKVFWVIAVFAACSLLLSEWGWRNHPRANFYLAPTRAWELLAGSIAAFVARDGIIKKSDPLAFTGLAAVIGSIFLYDRHTLFPSFYALAPVIGTVLIVVYSGNGTLTARLLGTKTMAAIGLISYSAYLWHQPIISFYKYRFETSIFGLIVAIGISFMLAALSWRYVEVPFRDREKILKNRFITYIGVMALLTATIGLVGYKNIGNALTLVRDDPFNGLYRPRTVDAIDQFKKSGSNNFILWGDSYANALAFPLGDIFSSESSGFSAYIAMSCPSLIGVVRNENDRLGADFGAQCIEINRNVMTEISKEEHKGKHIVLTSAYYWYQYAVNAKGEAILLPTVPLETDDTIAEGLKNTVVWLQKIGLKPIVILASPIFDELDAVIRKNFTAAKLLEVDVSEVISVNERMTSALSSTNAKIIDPVEILCGGKEPYCRAFDEGNGTFITWYDGSHLSEFGGQLISKSIYGIIMGDYNEFDD